LFPNNTYINAAILRQLIEILSLLRTSSKSQFKFNLFNVTLEAHEDILNNSYKVDGEYDVYRGMENLQVDAIKKLSHAVPL